MARRFSTGFELTNLSYDQVNPHSISKEAARTGVYGLALRSGNIIENFHVDGILSAGVADEDVWSFAVMCYIRVRQAPTDVEPFMGFKGFNQTRAPGVFTLNQSGEIEFRW